MNNRIDSELIRRAIKRSPFLFEQIAQILEISERSLYHKLKNDTLRISELNIIMEVLNLNIKDIVKGD